MSFKDYITGTNTIKNPLDTLFPKTREKVTGKEPPVIKEEPLFEGIKNGFTKIKDKAIDIIEEVKSGTITLFTVLIIGGILYLISSNKK